MEELDYFLLPEGAWSKLTSWYDLSQNSRPLARKVVEHGMYMKHCKVEVYLLEFKLCIHPNVNNTKPRSFSRADTVDGLEKALKEEFEIDMNAKCRVWHRFMTHTYELLSNPTQTLQDAGLYNGQVCERHVGRHTLSVEAVYSAWSLCKTAHLLITGVPRKNGQGQHYSSQSEGRSSNFNG